jgi:protein-S-isoprenylcysteine O-methyltransferase Ste14
MTPLPFVLPYALVYWPVVVWAFAPEIGIARRAAKGAAQDGSRDAGSLRVIMLGMNVAFLAAFSLAFVPSLRMSPAVAVWAFAAGLGVIVAGSLLRRHCFRMLGAHFTGEVRAEARQPVVDRGAYRWVRHPSYVAGTLMNVGIGLALGSWVGVALLTATSIAVYHYRMNVEERALADALGEPYRAYMRGRKRLIPYVY